MAGPVLGQSLAGIARRLARPGLVGNLGANGVAQAIQIAIQLIAVPVLAHALGLQHYGIWLMLATIPAYLANGDFGLVIASQTDMTVRFARGDRAGAARRFQALLRAVGRLGLAVAAMAVVAAALAPAGAVAAIAAADRHPQVLIAAILVLGAVIPLTQALLAAFRAVGEHAAGVYAVQAITVAEQVAILGIAAFSGELWAMACGFCAVRLAGTLWMGRRLKQRWPFYFQRQPGSAEGGLPRLWHQALAAFMLPLGNIATLQGMVAVVGAVMGPAVLPVFTATRAIARIPLQLAHTLCSAALPDFTVAMARGDRERADELVTLTLAAMALVLVPTAVVLAIAGPAIIAAWTLGQLAPSWLFVALMAGGALLGGLWLPLANLLVAINRQASFGYGYLVVAAAVLAGAWAVMLAWGIEGVAGALLLGEAAMAALVVWRLRQHGLVSRALLAQAPRRLTTLARRLFETAS